MPHRPRRPRRSIDLASPARLRFAHRLREAREQVGLTQAEVSKRTGVPRPTISDIENGKHNVTVDMMDKLANAIGRSLSDLLMP